MRVSVNWLGGSGMERIEEALSIPFIVFPGAAVFAIVVAWILHHVDRFYAPGVALVMVVIIMALGFLASSRTGES
jgi:hypothetical protein